MGPPKGNRAPRRGRRGQRRGRGAAAPSTDHLIPRPMRPWICTRAFSLGPYLPVAGDYGGMIQSALNQLPAFSDFTNLFQEYKFHWASVEFSYIPAATERYSPVIWTANLANAGLSAPATLLQMQQLTGTRKFAVGPDKRTLKAGFAPRLRTSDTQFIMLRSPWISTADAGAAHQGLGYWFQFFNTTNSPGSEIHISVTYTIALRGSL